MKKNASYMLRSFEVLCRNIIQNYTEKFIKKAKNRKWSANARNARSMAQVIV
jgi:hypothetical protein